MASRRDGWLRARSPSKLSFVAPTTPQLPVWTPHDQNAPPRIARMFVCRAGIVDALAGWGGWVPWAVGGRRRPSDGWVSWPQWPPAAKCRSPGALERSFASRGSRTRWSEGAGEASCPREALVVLAKSVEVERWRWSTRCCFRRPPVAKLPSGESCEGSYASPGSCSCWDGWAGGRSSAGDAVRRPMSAASAMVSTVLVPRVHGVRWWRSYIKKRAILRTNTTARFAFLLGGTPSAPTTMRGRYRARERHRSRLNKTINLKIIVENSPFLQNLIYQGYK